jgi:hypothetical protein
MVEKTCGQKPDDIDPVIKTLGRPSVVNLQHDHLFEENTEEERAKRSKEMKEEEEKEKKPFSPRKKKILTIIVVLVLLVAIAGSAYLTYNYIKNRPEKLDIPGLEITNKNMYTYKGFEFRRNKDTTWSTQIFNPITQTLFVVSLHYGPKDLYDIPIDHSVRDWLTYAIDFTSEKADNESVGATFITFEPDVQSGFHAIAYHELAKNLDEGLMLRPHPALTEETNQTIGNKTIPMKSCDSTDEPVILLLHKEPTKVSYNGKNCILIQGLEQNIVKAANRLLFQFYSVME